MPYEEFLKGQEYLDDYQSLRCLREAKEIEKNASAVSLEELKKSLAVIDEKAVIMPKKLIDKSQAYFWTKKWQDGEKQAEKDIEEGRVKTFENVAELFKDLEE